MKKYLVYLLFIFSFYFVNAQQDKSKEIEAECRGKLIECINQYSSVALYQIYINIDLMHNNSDIVENYELFDNMLFILENQLTTLSDYLDTYNKCKLFEKKDFDLLFNIKGIIFDLNKDIDLFRKFLETSNEDDFTTFFKHHQKTYIRMNKLFNIDESLQEDTE